MADSRRWIRVDADLFDDPVVIALADEHGPAGVLGWIAVLCAAKVGDGEARTTYAALGRRSGCTTAEAEAIVDYLERVGWVVVEADAPPRVSITVRRWSDFQSNPPGAAERQRRYRDRHRVTPSVTESVRVTSRVTSRVTENGSSDGPDNETTRQRETEALQASSSRVSAPPPAREAPSATTTIIGRASSVGAREVVAAARTLGGDTAAALLVELVAPGARLRAYQSALLSNALGDAPEAVVAIAEQAAGARSPIGYLLENVKAGAHVDASRIIPLSPSPKGPPVDPEADARRRRVAARLAERMQP